ncbi:MULTISPECIES: DUF4097 family beta strand repeat-containing protein [unclassified Streptomyces]|uniref:DUF4097 family beta strand repeat-containing protein n=1 Tax=unclassified Streptomyces TaxID=2593676 RepID=UPI0037F8D91A
MAESTWEVAEPEKLTFDAPVTALHVRLVNGTVNVVGTERKDARLEVSGLEGPPLKVTLDGSTLTVAYEDLPWSGILTWLGGKSRVARWSEEWRRSAVVSLSVPADTSIEVGTLGAGTVISGVRGHTDIRGLTGDTTFVGLSGEAHAETLSGSLEAQAVTGALRFHSLSGDLTVIEGAGSSVQADSVSGDMVIDLDPGERPTDIRLTTVSGEVAIRLPHPADARVEANTASGSVSNAFDDLRVTGHWGAKKITGRLGAGTGILRATTVSGSIALLRRPPAQDAPYDTDTAQASPADTKEL